MLRNNCSLVRKTKIGEAARSSKIWKTVYVDTLATEIKDSEQDISIFVELQSFTFTTPLQQG